MERFFEGLSTAAGDDSAAVAAAFARLADAAMHEGSWSPAGPV
jgi:hypothetical protein